MSDPVTGAMIGKVTSLTVTGNGPASAMIVFVLHASEINSKVFVVTAYPGFEPQVFSGMSSLLVSAFYFNGDVEVTYFDFPGEEARCTNVTLNKKYVP